MKTDPLHPSFCRTLRTALILLFASLTAYVGWIQLAGYNDLFRKSQIQQTRLLFIPGKRGSIVDRNDIPLNYDVPHYSIVMNIEQLRDPRDTRTATVNKVSAAIADLSARLGPDVYRDRPSQADILNHIRQNAPMPLVLWKDPTPSMIQQFVACKSLFPAADLTLSWKRTYAFPESAPHLRGFTSIGHPPADNVEGRKLNGLESVGQTGIEKRFNDVLRGTPGYQQLQTDVFTYRRKTMDTRRSEPGKDIALTIDIHLQETAEKSFRNRQLRGALVLMDADSGEVLCMASVPAYHLPPQKKDSQLPGAYINRALSGFYPPGSTIKPLIALAALQQGVLSPEDAFSCRGFFQLDEQNTLACSSHFGHGTIRLSRAIAASCNTYFCEVGTRLDWQQVDELASYIGLGKRLNTVFWQDELAGIAFTPHWVQDHRQTVPWGRGDAANASIGQGNWIVTPLQMAVYACAITTGKVLTPQFLVEHDDPLMDTISWPDEIWRPVLQGMKDCVSEPYGTAKALRINGIDILAKTGTAEHRQGRQPHAWVMAALPADHPKLIGVCIVEEGGHGGSVAAPLLREVLEQAVQSFLPVQKPSSPSP